MYRQSDEFARPAQVGDPYSLESLIAWLEKQPGDKVYCYTGNCLYEQYAEHLGLGERAAAYNAYVQRVTGKVGVEPWANVVRDTPHTFGAALGRARGALAEQRQ